MKTLFVALALVVVLAGCGGGSSRVASTMSAGPTLTFGTTVSLTGSTAKEGSLTLEGYQLWRDQVNQHGGIKVGNTTYQIAIKYYDDASDAAKSKQLMQQLITQDHVNFLLGPYGTSSTLAVAPLADQYQIPLADSNGAANVIFSQGYKFVFGVLSPAAEYAQVMIQAARSQPNPPANVAIIFADDSFSKEVAAAARDYATSIGFPVVDYQSYPANTNDVTAVVAALKTSGPNGTAPEMILGSGHANEAIATMKTVKLYGINARLYGFTVGPATPDFVDALGPDANDVIGSAQWTAQVKYQGVDIFGTSDRYNTLYKQAFGHEPAYQSADATAAALALQFAIQQAQSIDPVKVRDALASLDIMTFYGRLKFNAQGINASKPMATVQIQNGNLVTVYPNDIANGLMVYPSPIFGNR